MTRKEIALAFLGAIAIGCISLSWPVKADQSCALSIDAGGRVSGICAAASTPTQPAPPAPPTPPAPPSNCSAPSGAVMGSMVVGGTNNWVRESNGAIHIFPVPTNLAGGNVVFASTPGMAQTLYEVAFSKCPGDFTYYQTDAASVKVYGQTWYPCGLIAGADMSLGWSTQGPSMYACAVPPGDQWYMNWRPVSCPAGATCGQTFYVPRG